MVAKGNPKERKMKMSKDKDKEKQRNYVVSFLGDTGRDSVIVGGDSVQEALAEGMERLTVSDSPYEIRIIALSTAKD